MITDGGILINLVLLAVLSDVLDRVSGGAESPECLASAELNKYGK